MRKRLQQVVRLLGLKEERVLLLLALGIGLATGAASVGFKRLVDLAIELYYDSAMFDRITGGGPLLWLLPLLPASGGLLVGLITYYFAREAKGHGVPEVMDAIARRGGVIRPRVALAKAFGSAITIGSGGSAGTEGPIVQIGAAIGSSSGQLLRLGQRQLPVLIGCGAAAGIAAIFNAPIAGVLFALEIFLYDFSFRTFTPVVLSSVMSATMAHALLGEDKAMLALPRGWEYQFQYWEVGNYVLLGVLAGVLAAVYIRSLYKSEDLFDIRLKWIHPVVRPALGGLLLGVVGIVLLNIPSLRFAEIPGAPATFGNGYPFLTAMLDPANYRSGQFTLIVLGALLAGKLLSTCLTLGSGGSGGVFAPSLFMGAALGGLLGLVLRIAGMDVNPTAYAIVGMAAVFGGSTHAFLTAIVMLFEMTHDYRVVLPIMLAATIATVVSQKISRESIYTEKLARRGIRMGMVADLTLLRRISVSQLPLSPAACVHEHEPLSEVIARAAASPTADFVIVDDHEHYRGMIVAEDLRVALLQPEAVPLLLVDELLRSDIPVVRRPDNLIDVFDKFSRHDVAALPVADPDDPERIIGLVTRSAMIKRYQQELSASHGYGAPPPPPPASGRQVNEPPLTD